MFDDDDFDFEEFSDEENDDLNKEIAEERRRFKSHPLLIQSKVIYEVLLALLDNDDECDQTLLDSSTIILAKLHGCLRSDSYVVRMQNAAIIRDHAEYLRLSHYHLQNNPNLDLKYIEVFKEEMEKFRELFKIWASEINKMKPDDLEDEWGLFIK